MAAQKRLVLLTFHVHHDLTAHVKHDRRWALENENILGKCAVLTWIQFLKYLSPTWTRKHQHQVIMIILFVGRKQELIKTFCLHFLFFLLLVFLLFYGWKIKIVPNIESSLAECGRSHQTGRVSLKSMCVGGVGVWFPQSVNVSVVKGAQSHHLLRSLMLKTTGLCLTWCTFSRSVAAREWWGPPGCLWGGSCCLERSWRACQRAAFAERMSGQRQRNLRMKQNKHLMWQTSKAWKEQITRCVLKF